MKNETRKIPKEVPLIKVPVEHPFSAPEKRLKEEPKESPITVPEIDPIEVPRTELNM